jgi:long-chain acyl-CoA synthetase
MHGTFTPYCAPLAAGSLSLGRTLPSLLDEACDRHPNPHALNQWHHHHWQPLSTLEFRDAANRFALGLLSLGVQRGDRLALIMHSDIAFCIADLGSLLAGAVNVPIDLTQTIENILFILKHTAAKILIISNLDLLYQVMPYLSEAPTLKTVIIAEVPEDWPQVRAQLLNSPPPILSSEILDSREECLQVPHLLEGHPHPPLPGLPTPLNLLSLAEVSEQGQESEAEIHLQQLRSALHPQDLATIIYIASETKRPRGVMLSHENISANILAAFSSYPHLETGDHEVVLLFLPLTHIFARAFFYGHLHYGHSIYFSDPNHVARHLRTVNPTFLITVPRLLEKVHERILEQGRRLPKFERAVFVWALKLAQRYRLEQPPHQLYRLQLRLADRLVFERWRAGFGNRIKAVISGGAALRADLAQQFTAAGIPILQGYGLTETSGVLCYTRGAYNRAGTVGVPIPGVDMALATDGEILVKSPFVMQGYFGDPEASQTAIDAKGWFHTGDLGEITAEGFLRIVGVKKALFKLSTGKYVSPLPLETELNQSPLVAQAVVVGVNQKFCGLLIFPQVAALQDVLAPMDVDLNTAAGWQHPCVLAQYQALVDAANCHLPYWATIRKFRLIQAELTGEQGLLDPNGCLNRQQVWQTFAAEIDALYGLEAEVLVSDPDPAVPGLDCLAAPSADCPVYARSLTRY